MAEWTTIPDDVLEPGKPIRSVDAIALRDNPVAIAEGAAGAPRVQWEAIVDALAGASVGAVGTYAFARRVIDANSTYATAGDTKPGSELNYGAASNAGAVINSFGSSLPGTWRCMGHLQNTSTGAATGVTLWLRIS